MLIWVTLLAGLLALMCGVWANKMISKEWGLTWLVTLQQITSGAIGAVLTAAFLTFLTRYLLRIETKIDEVTPMTARDGHDRIVRSMRESKSWRHDGQLGRWVRKSVISEFRSRSKEDGAKRTIAVVILDPDNASLLQEFVEYHAISRGLPSTSGLARDLQSEVLSTILWAGVAQQNYLAINVEVWLRRNVCFVRTDIGDRIAFDTLPGPHTPVIAMNADERDCDYYIAADRKFEAAKSISKKVDLGATVLSDPPDLQQAKEFFLANYIACAADLALIEEALARPGPNGDTKY
ncbi:hypothetical protein ACFVYA_24480 [Amycolatopsis sp. NPDC058278]|uniref:hypothetical protein n=1 Tax=Amycolatopsis sp. NPDC058278 TaxID=3346417 RepID=UPI0036D822B0